MSFSMTKRMHDLLVFIEGYLAETGGVAPSYDEMKVAIGVTSKSRISAILKCLEKRGQIIRLPDRARAIQVVRQDVGFADLIAKASNDDLIEMRRIIDQKLGSAA